MEKRHSFSELGDQQAIHVLDELSSSERIRLSDSTMVTHQTRSKEQCETINESLASDMDCESSSCQLMGSALSSVSTTTTSKSVLNLKSLLKTPTTPKNTSRRVIFNPLALLLDAAAIGELDLLIKSAKQVRLILRRLSLQSLLLR